MIIFKKKLKIIPKNPYLLRLVIHDRKYFWSVLKKKGAGGELVSGGVEKVVYTWESSFQLIKTAECSGGGPCPSYATIYGTGSQRWHQDKQGLGQILIVFLKNLELTIGIGLIQNELREPSVHNCFHTSQMPCGSINDFYYWLSPT